MKCAFRVHLYVQVMHFQLLNFNSHLSAEGVPTTGGIEAIDMNILYFLYKIFHIILVHH